MNIGVLGSGNIGGTIGRKWAEAGHSVHFGVRDPAAKAKAADPDLSSMAVEFVEVPQAIEDSEIVLLAIPSAAVKKVAEQHGDKLAGKVVIDATNDFSRDDMSSLGLLADLAPGAMLYRAFNSLGWENFAEPDFDGVKADHFYCGPEATSALTIVEGLISAVGLRPIRLGDNDMSPLLDNMTRIWASLAMGQDRGRHLAFKLLTEASGG